MEIISYGTLPSTLHDATCSNCKTQFRFKESEAQMVSDPRDGNYWTIKCPLSGCNNIVTVKA